MAILQGVVLANCEGDHQRGMDKGSRDVRAKSEPL